MSNRVTVRACAKINLSLRVIGVRADGFHEVRTTLQSIALHDVLTFTRTRGAFEIECDDPACPSGARNIVSKAAAALWRVSGRGGRPRGVHVRIDKRIPMAAGLGGGSADAAAALRGLAALWRVALDPAGLSRVAARLGADVPFFLEGGTALGVERGEVVYPLIDAQRRWVLLVVPAFGISTPDAYRWWDEASRPTFARASAGNDLEPPVVRRHPHIGRIVRALNRAGAAGAAMSGSGSAVFGLFDSRDAAEEAADALGPGKDRAIVTRTLSRTEYARFTAPLLARK